jgi:hypothetical protein
VLAYLYNETLIRLANPESENRVALKPVKAKNSLKFAKVLIIENRGQYLMSNVESKNIGIL